MNGLRPRYRIAMVAACPFPSLRGSQVLIRELAEALAGAGHEVHVVTYPAGEHVVPVRGFRIHRARSRGGLDGSRSWWAKLVLDVALIAALYRVVRDHAIDVIHAHNYEGPLVSYAVRWMLGTPVVYHSHNVMSDELPYYFTGPIARWIARWVGRVLDRVVPRCANYCVALSPEIARFLTHRGVAGNRIAVVPPAIARPSRRKIENGGMLFPGNDVVLYAGNVDPYQSLETLLRAFAHVRQKRPNAVLVIAAPVANAPAARRRLVAIAAIPGVVVSESRSFQSTRTILGRADVVVCPRSSWSGFPIKLLNFMSLGKAIVVCKSVAKIVQDGQTGVVVPDGDEWAMAAAITGLLQDCTQRAALGIAARQAVAVHHTWAVLLPRIESLYAETVGRPSGYEAIEEQGGRVRRIGLMAPAEDRISPRASTRRTGNE
jgi:glycosyltransferase involved in cell wall biosynthesis